VRPCCQHNDMASQWHTCAAIHGYLSAYLVFRIQIAAFSHQALHHLKITKRAGPVQRSFALMCRYIAPPYYRYVSSMPYKNISCQKYLIILHRVGASLLNEPTGDSRLSTADRTVKSCFTLKPQILEQIHVTRSGSGMPRDRAVVDSIRKR